jgi:hypothetical protein
MDLTALLEFGKGLNEGGAPFRDMVLLWLVWKVTRLSRAYVRLDRKVHVARSEAGQALLSVEQTNPRFRYPSN